MKKLVILIMTGVIVAAGYIAVSGQYKVIDKQEQEQLDQFKQEQSRVEELKKLQQNPQIVQKELKKVGKLVVLQGQIQYSKPIKDSKKLFKWDVTLREITLDLTYQFGISMPLEYIKVKKITDDKTVILEVPKSRLKLEYIQLNAEKSRVINGKTFILADQFSPSDVEVMVEQSQEAVVNRIGNNKENYKMAMSSLKTQLEGLILGLGYYNRVIFEEV